MSQRWKLWVECSSDKALVQSLVRQWSIQNVELDVIGGGVNHLAKIKQQIIRSSDAGNHVALILDADSDYEQQDAEVTKKIDRLKLPVERYFLLPDNQHSGNLETLLECIAAVPYRAIYDCLDEYGTCLQRHDQSYRYPEPKGRVYAYCEALSIKTNPSKRCYDGSPHWDLDAPVLEPLKRFLASLC